MDGHFTCDRELLMRRWLGIIIAVIIAMSWGDSLYAGQPVVRAILFYSLTCPHCHVVITDVLPPLNQKYGEQLQVEMLNVNAEGQTLYQAAIQQFNISTDRQGVPMLVVGTIVLVGSDEIATQFPALIESGLRAGGVEWPNLPGIQAALAAARKTASTEPRSVGEKLMQDPFGNGLAIIVLVGMLAAVGWVVVHSSWRTSRVSQRTLRQVDSTWRKWAIPGLVVVGLLVSGYLAYVEMKSVTPVCPIGDCPKVQQSEYAFLFGVIPVGLLGVVGNVAILGVWLVKWYGDEQWRSRAAKGLFVLTTFGVLYSIYLTFLEPFVLGATCFWCLCSAVVMTGMFWLSSEDAWVKDRAA